MIAANSRPAVGAAGNTHTPAVSLCIPAYQAERHLKATLDAVFSQTFQDMEIVVLDNNTTDGTSKILEQASDPRLRVVRNDCTLPMPENWNRVVDLCRGKYVKLVCADDLIDETCVADQAAILENCPDVALVACKTTMIDDGGHPLRRSTGLRNLTGKHDGKTVVRHIVRSGGNPIGPTAAVTFRRNDFAAVGGFDGDLLYPMELELWIRLLQRGDFVGQPDPHAAFRVSGGSATALTSARSQMSQQVELIRRVTGDERWKVGRADRVIGKVGALTMQARRTLLFTRAALRCGRR